MPARELTHDGLTLPVREWSRRTGIAARTILERIDTQGRTVADALTAPVTQKNRRGGRHPANMPRPCPKLKRSSEGGAYVRWKASGRNHERHFGKWGTDKAGAAYRRFAAQWATGGIEVPAPAGGLSLAELIGRWLDHVERTYTKDGKQTSEIDLSRAACVGWLAHFGESGALVADVKAADLHAVIQAWVDAGKSFNTIRSYHCRAVRLFVWGLGNDLVPASVVATLRAVEYLKRGRTAAKDPAPRKEATDEQIAAALAHLSARGQRLAQLAAMVALQQFAGMRPGEVCALTPADLDRSADVWRYTVGAANKNRHRGRAQVYYFGPRAIEALAPHLAGVADSERVFPVPVATYGRAIKTACVRAGCAVWTPHQLRHKFATDVARTMRSLTHAAAAIGDTSAVAKATYIHVDPQERAKIEVARAMG